MSECEKCKKDKEDRAKFWEKHEAELEEKHKGREVHYLGTEASKLSRRMLELALAETIDNTLVGMLFDSGVGLHKFPELLAIVRELAGWKEPDPQWFVNDELSDCWIRIRELWLRAQKFKETP